ncbi:histidine phosphatase family protein [Patescibacteria group bacterium]|nr:histidine phosphatase family protein [Patescibacteria group bacterium]
MATVKIYDFRHYERQKAAEDQNATLQDKIKKDQNPTLYGLMTSYIVASILKFSGVKFQKAITSPQPRAWKLARIILDTLGHSFDVKTDLIFDDIGSDPNAKNLIKIAKQLEKENSMTVEHVFLTQPGEIRDYVFKRASEQVQAMLAYAAGCTENTNILCCRHGVAVEAVGSLIKALTYDVKEVYPQNISVGSIGGPLSTCEGLIYTFDVNNGIAVPVSVEEFRLPDEVKHLEKIFTK